MYIRIYTEWHIALYYTNHFIFQFTALYVNLMYTRHFMKDFIYCTYRAIYNGTLLHITQTGISFNLLHLWLISQMWKEIWQKFSIRQAYVL